MIDDMATYTDQERQTLRTAAFGAVFLVSKAEPGFFDMVKESFAGSRAFAKSPDLRDILRSGGFPQMPQGSADDIEQGVLSALGQSQEILAAKGGDELKGFQTAISEAVDEVAKAAGGGASPKEADAIDKVKAALVS
jgi:hypothetical protein